MENCAQHFKQSSNKNRNIKKKNKIEVNACCPCGSGLKFKKCCKKKYQI
ncbi:SEC-C metal-binding domain-containing protein [Legionella massiliensis]